MAVTIESLAERLVQIEREVSEMRRELEFLLLTLKHESKDQEG